MTIPRPRLKAILPLLILAVAVAGAALLIATRPEVTAQPLEERAWPVQVAAVEFASHAPVLRLQGFLEAPRAATLRAGVEADVARVHVREGDSVAVGALLVELADAELRLALREREAELAALGAQLEVERRRSISDREELAIEQRMLELAARELERVDQLARQDFSSATELERARRALEQHKLAVSARRFAVDSAEARIGQLEARLDGARALRDRARLNLERSRIRAPIAGRLAAVEVAAGDRVHPGEPLLALYDAEGLEIRALLPAAHLGAVRAAMAAGGLEGSAEVDGERLAVTLSRLAGRSSGGQGGVEALFSVAGKAAADLVVGRFASLELRLPAQPDTLVLPFEALYETDRVYRVDGERLQAVTVERLGEAWRPDGRRGVLLRAPALQTGDRVLTTQLPQAMSGLRVRVLEQAPDA